MIVLHPRTTVIHRESFHRGDVWDKGVSCQNVGLKSFPHQYIDICQTRRYKNTPRSLSFLSIPLFPESYKGVQSPELNLIDAD